MISQDRGVAVIDFTVLGEPRSKARPRFNRATGMAYTPKETRIAEGVIAACYVSEAHGRILHGSISVEVEFHLWRKSRRDIDNLLKLVLDALNGVAYGDDFSVDRVTAARHWATSASEARTHIVVSGG